jgi:hypothetical protein
MLYVQLSELYAGITAALRGPIDDRAGFFYSLFDTDGSGALDTDEVLRMLIASSGGGEVSEQDARRVLAKIDADGSGTVERDEFITAVRDDPSIVDALSRVFGRTDVKTSLLGGGDDDSDSGSESGKSDDDSQSDDADKEKQQNKQKAGNAKETPSTSEVRFIYLCARKVRVNATSLGGELSFVH